MKLDIHYFFNGKYAQWIVMGLISFFSLLIIGEIGAYFFLPIPNLISPKPDNNIIINTKSDKSQDILNSSLFGVYVPSNLNESSVKKSILQVSLVGVLLADRIEDSQVIIRSVNGEEKTYTVGDFIPGGAIIQRITPGGVLVERNGALESISLPKSNLTFEPAPAPLKEDQIP